MYMKVYNLLSQSIWFITFDFPEQRRLAVAVAKDLKEFIEGLAEGRRWDDPWDHQIALASCAYDLGIYHRHV